MKISPHQDNTHSLSTAPLMKEVIYTPASIRQHGWRLWGNIANELLDSRQLLWRLVWRDFSVRYRQSLLGYFWAILPPVAAAAIFTLVAASRTISVPQTSFPYVAYALWSLSFWQFFGGCLSGCTNSLINAGPLVTKLNFAKETLVIAAVGQPVFDFLIRLVLVVLVFTWYGIRPQWQMLLLPFILLPATLLALGLGLMLSVATLVIRDISNIVSMAVTFGIVMTPVLYPPPVRWPLNLINVVNPFSPVLIASQDLIAYGTLTTPVTFLCACLFSALIFFAGLWFFRLTLPRISQHA
jgi:lipopolysaccharide transport system permease protein